MPGESKQKAIVMGCSAGGLAALSFILEKLPANYSVPVIVVQHRIKDQRQLLEEILQNKCGIKIKQVDEKEEIKTGIVYLAPPDYHLLIEKDYTFSLSRDQPVCFSRPSIDVLFESAADVYKQDLAGIILTGSNRDGAQGMLCIKNNKGTTIAQDPQEAEFPYMPAAAIEFKGVEQVWSLTQIREFLLTLNRM